jgi:hypothetical protein
LGTGDNANATMSGTTASNIAKFATHMGSDSTTFRVGWREIAIALIDWLTSEIA